MAVFVIYSDAAKQDLEHMRRWYTQPGAGQRAKDEQTANPMISVTASRLCSFCLAEKHAFGAELMAGYSN